MASEEGVISGEEVLPFEDLTSFSVLRDEEERNRLKKKKDEKKKTDWPTDRSVQHSTLANSSNFLCRV